MACLFRRLSKEGDFSHLSDNLSYSSIDPASQTLPAPVAPISEEPSSATSFHRDPPETSFSLPPTVELSSFDIEEPTESNPDVDALFSTEEEGQGAEEWLQDEVNVPSSDLAPVVPSSSPPLSPPPPASALATDELSASDDAPLDSNDFLAEDGAEDPQQEQVQDELHRTFRLLPSFPRPLSRPA